MELRQFEYFVAVVEEANFTRAAARLHVAQPGVSAQIRRLEREFGEDLLDRSGRVVRLTEAGRAVLPYARAALRAVEGARLAVDELAGLVRGKVRVGSVVSVAAVGLDIPGLLADFHREYPGVEISLSEENSARMVEALRDGRLDVAFIGLGDEEPDGVEVRVVHEESLAVVVSRDDDLASRKSIGLEDIRGRPLIALPKGTGLRAAVDGAFEAAGVRPRVAFEGSDPSFLARLIGRGLGVAVMPESLIEAHATDLCAIPIARHRPSGRIALAWRSDGQINPASRALIAHARTRWPEK